MRDGWDFVQKSSVGRLPFLCLTDPQTQFSEKPETGSVSLEHRTKWKLRFLHLYIKYFLFAVGVSVRKHRWWCDYSVWSPLCVKQHSAPLTALSFCFLLHISHKVSNNEVGAWMVIPLSLSHFIKHTSSTHPNGQLIRRRLKRPADRTSCCFHVQIFPACQQWIWNWNYECWTKRRTVTQTATAWNIKCGSNINVSFQLHGKREFITKPGTHRIWFPQDVWVRIKMMYVKQEVAVQ